MKVQGREERDVVRTYGVKSYPSLVLADAAGKAFVTKVGAAGLDSPANFNIWLDLQLEGAEALPGMLEKARSTEDPAELMEIAGKLAVLGRHTEAAETYARAEKMLEGQLVAVRLERAKLLVRGNIDSTELREVMDALLPAMIEAKDDRIVPLAFPYVNIVARLAGADNNPARAREIMLDLREAFPLHESVRPMRNFAAMYAHLDGDDETALAEMKAMIAEDEANEVDDPYTKRARAFVARLEKGERYR